MEHKNVVLSIILIEEDVHLLSRLLVSPPIHSYVICASDGSQVLGDEQFHVLHAWLLHATVLVDSNGLQVQDGGSGLEGDVREEGRSHEEMEVGRHQVEEGVEERGDVVARTDVDARLRREFPSILTLSDRKHSKQRNTFSSVLLARVAISMSRDGSTPVVDTRLIFSHKDSSMK